MAHARVGKGMHRCVVVVVVFVGVRWYSGTSGRFFFDGESPSGPEAFRFVVMIAEVVNVLAV